MTESRRGPAPRLDDVLARLQGLHPRVIDLSLGRIERLLAALDHPERRLPPVIHVAGTNGKGSVIAYLRAMVEASGQRAHVYTSPHLVRFNERIRLAGEIVEDGALVDALLEVEAANKGKAITFFEVTTAAAFLLFARADADVMLLETGLGGRLDATNVVDRPTLTIVTPISIDHTQFLGDTIRKIAFEKAGIIKRGVPVVISDQPADARDVLLDIARERGAEAFVRDRDWRIEKADLSVVYTDGDGSLVLPKPCLPGEHQIDNAATAVAAARRATVLSLTGTHLAAGLRRTEWPARLQRLGRGPVVALASRHGGEVWLDGGHNPGAGAALAASLEAIAPGRTLHLVLAMLDTKDAAGFLAPFRGRAASVTRIPMPGGHAEAPRERVAAAARDAGIALADAPSLVEAVEAIFRHAPGARILVCGSLYLAGEVLKDHG